MLIVFSFCSALLSATVPSSTYLSSVDLELKRQGIDLESMSLSLSLNVSPPLAFVRILDAQGQIKEEQSIEDLPQDFEAGVAHLVLVATGLLEVEKATPHFAPRKSRRDREAEFLTQRAYMVGSSTHYKDFKWGVGGISYEEGDDIEWGIVIGPNKVTHYKFAKALAKLNGAEVDAKVKERFEPQNPRKNWIPMTGFIAGGVSLGLGAFGGLILASPPSNGSRSTSEQSSLTAMTAGGLGLGALLMAGSITYIALTDKQAARDDAEIYKQSEAAALVEQYNYKLRQKLDLPLEAPTAGDDELKVRNDHQGYARTQSSTPRIQVALSPVLSGDLWGASLQARF